jgi:hypothetical protein
LCFSRCRYCAKINGTLQVHVGLIHASIVAHL